MSYPELQYQEQRQKLQAVGELPALGHLSLLDVLMLMMIATGMYRYLFGALADTFILIPVNGAVLRADSLVDSMLEFLSDYVIIGFRIVLPIFCSILLLNAVLGVLAKVAPQMNMFAVGIQLKVLVGLSVLFLTVGMLPGIGDFVSAG